MINWKARCAELADRLDDALIYTVQSDTERSMRQLIARTRAELAKPEPEGVTDKDLETTARAAENQYMKEHGGLTAPTPDGIHALLQKQRLAGLRAIAARYARPAIAAELEGGND
jgi:hypothetical protein